MTADGATGDDDIWLRNEHLGVALAPPRGAEIRYLGRSGGPNVLFHQAWPTPVRASRSTSYGSTELDWLSEWRGGWQELFPNAGAQAEVSGIPLAFHGDASSARWQVLERDETSVTVRTATRLPITLTRRMWLDPAAPVLHLEETAHNESNLRLPFLWGHHPAFDAIAGCALDVPADRAVVPDDYLVSHADLAAGEYHWPLARAVDGTEVDLRVLPDGPLERVVYLPDVRSGWAALRRPDGLGIALAFDTSVYRHLWLWFEIGGVDFPWYGRSRVMAVEPQSCWPNDGLTAAVRRGRAHQLEPATSISSWLTVALFDASADEVSHVSRQGEVSVGRPAG